ncbi:hypothetical protein KKB64_00870 [Patescibacteria group bacterium]|nr:hypothetical protein [Patescibacteria group bacterium]MBU1472326.1 hypothetical protein [Patescibacteria group bacterium]MBU2460422.1 hypothetical protein [Patescibacteria group bacterium]MBU2544241.1 hypothetical protein [Patescibacteria group bacterium]
MNDFEKFFSSLFDETYKKFYGVHRWKLGQTALAAVSSPGWASFVEHLQILSPADTFVVSPELITTTEIGTDEVVPARALIEERIDYVKTVSAHMPATIFLLGTPVFGDRENPTNSVLYLKAGGIIGQANKRSGVTEWEKAHFTFMAEEPPSLVPGSDIGVLICADLATATLYLRNELVNERVLQLGGRDNLIGAHPRFIHPKARTLVVPSCWGIGANQNLVAKVNHDEYYRLQLQAISASVLRHSPELEHIVVVDRCPEGPFSPQEFFATKPLNVLFKRK